MRTIWKHAKHVVYAYLLVVAALYMFIAFPPAFSIDVKSFFVGAAAVLAYVIFRSVSDWIMERGQNHGDRKTH
jgi:cytochrome bd-type quinol oxidase subunit 2